MKFKQADIFIDVDGTIYTPELGEVSSEFYRQVERLRRGGFRVFLASGRTTSFLHDSLYPDLCDGYVLAHGKQIILNDEMIYSEYIESDVLKRLLALFDENDIDYVCYGDDYSYINDYDTELYRYLKTLFVELEKFKLIADDFPAQRIYKIEAWSCNEVDWDEIFATFEDLKYDPDPVSPRIDINLKDATKSGGIKKMLSALDRPFRSVCFGDGLNDMDMFDLIDFPIAMGNGNERLKRKAKLVAPPVSEDGVAKVLSELFVAENE